MPKLPCLGCRRVVGIPETLVRVERSDMQTEFRVRLCSQCFFAMMDLFDAGADGRQDNLPGVFAARRRRSRARV